MFDPVLVFNMLISNAFSCAGADMDTPSLIPACADSARSQPGRSQDRARTWTPGWHYPTLGPLARGGGFFL